MKTQYGAALSAALKGEENENEVTARVCVELIADYITDFNIYAVTDGCLVVFKKLADCEAFAKKRGYQIVDRDGVRYFPHTNIIQRTKS